MKKITLFTFILVLASCAHDRSSYTSETMLPDGRTWEVRSNTPCDDIAEKIDRNLPIKTANKMLYSECSARLLEKITIQGAELCGTQPQRVFSCSSRSSDPQRAQEVLRGYGTCYVRCPAER